MKLNLKECICRQFDFKKKEIICKRDDLIKLVEDCLDCLIKENNKVECNDGNNL